MSQQNPAARPPFFPTRLISIQTELSHFHAYDPLLIHTELCSISHVTRTRTHPYRRPLPRRGITPPENCLDTILKTGDSTPRKNLVPSRHSTPHPKDVPPASRPTSERKTAAQEDSDDDDGKSRVSDDEDSASETHDIAVAGPDADGLISKPEGEVGRLKRGYPLQVVLGWDAKRYKVLKTKVNAYVADYLNHGASVSNQPLGKVEALIKLVSGSILVFVRIAL